MIDIVIPTIGRSSLRALLASIARASGPRPERIILVDDRRDRGAPLEVGELDADMRARISVLAGKAAGPAAARNTGWRASRAQWIAFLDDDVVVSETWLDDLARDLRDLPPDVAGSQANVTVPLPRERRATDWERNVAGLASAQWITADCAYRRADLLAAGGFDERFARAYREDADLALRIVSRGKRIVRGTRRTAHPVRAADWTVSVRLQAGNADDVLMDALHDADWRARAAAPRGAYRAHATTVATAAFALAAFAMRKPRAGTLLAGAWAVQVARFAWKRIAPGPRTPSEIGALLATSVAIPFAAVYHRARGYARLRALLNDAGRAPRPLPSAVLFDRDGTLVVDVPYNGDPARVQPMPGAPGALRRLRAAGIATAMISNQSGVALGKLTCGDVDAVNARIERVLGPLGPVLICAHAPDAGCSCRKPAPGLVEAAAHALGVAPRDCVVVGDIGADVEAAHAAGARAILVPTPVTRAEEIASAPLVARDLDEAVDIMLAGYPQRLESKGAA
ncbi:MAG: hydrolase, HAD-superfamily, subfamily [Candidatus Eremiobacteraeota bacterium]|nr:hydrolase, HAD-superfamily, subfamily [Candidatus Eremiobacteraeota bacterium]